MIVEPAPAKLNLALHVRARRDDGYHELETLFVFVGYGDLLTIADAETPAFTVSGPFAEALGGEGDNLVLRAERAFRAEVAPLPPLSVTLDKRLPVASGMGGGSADAAAMMRAMARRAGVATDDARLRAVAEALGSDVPACLLGRTAIGRGRGEDLTPVDGAAGIPVLLVNPGVALSTAAVFAGWDRVDRGGLPDGDLIAAATNARNDLEAAARAIAPAIGDVLDQLSAAPGVRLVRMSGSGATCFGLFHDAADCTAAADAIRLAEPSWWVLETALA